MNIGIEFATTRDAQGKVYWRVAPTISGTAKQRLYTISAAILIGFVIFMSIFAVAETPDPIIKPDQTVTLWGQR
jgi:hypothetical protein